MKLDSITLGETYEVSIAAQDADGVAIPIGAGWAYALRVCRASVGGPVVADVTLTSLNGTLSGKIDTGLPAFTAGVYYYDVRITDPDGNDTWSEGVKLTLNNRNTPSS